MHEYSYEPENVLKSQNDLSHSGEAKKKKKKFKFHFMLLP